MFLSQQQHKDFRNPPLNDQRRGKTHKQVHRNVYLLAGVALTGVLEIGSRGAVTLG